MEYVYAALLLHEKGKSITEEKIRAMLQSVQITVDENIIKTLLDSLEGVNIAEAIQKAVISTPVAVQEPKELEKKSKVEEEAPEEEMGLTKLFGS